MKHQHHPHQGIPVGKPYAPPPAAPAKRSSWWLKGAGALLLGAGCVAVGAFVLPKLESRKAPQGEPPPAVARGSIADTPELDPTAGKSALQMAMEAADAAQTVAEAEYTGVSVPEKLDSYTVTIPDQPKDEPTVKITRPAAEPVVVPQLPANSNHGDVAKAIDADIDRKLDAAKIMASPTADDAEFLRRVYLDLTGKIPSYEQSRAFLDSKDPYKRTKLIDEILASDAFGEHLAGFWTDLLIKRDFDNNKNLKTEAFHKWLAEKFNKGEPWNKIVHEMMTAEGKETENPAVFFLLTNQDNNQPAASKLVGATGNLFMGIQIQCAECHVHPFTSKWKPSDFWGMAAFFGHTRFEREGADKKGKGGIAIAKEVDSAKEMKKDKKDKSPPIPTGAVIAIPDPTNAKKTVGTAKAKFFEGAEPKLAEKGPYRPAVADWVTSSKNHYFAPAMVNRTWAMLFARGFVNPLDDMKDDNPASHPAALKLLAAEFNKSGYDVKHLIRCMLNTQAYQRSSRPMPQNKDDETLFSHMPVKVLTSDQLLDSIQVATRANLPKGGGGGGGKGKNAGGAPGLHGFFDVNEYGDDPRDYAYGIPHILKMMNTNVTNSAYEAATRIVKSNGSNKAKTIDDIYLTVLSRKPSPDENKRMQQFVAKQGEARGYGSVFWALLNSAEFVCNR
ncbi:hypothetical protein AYO44_00170 [Planctomycetaceae bacterium SCGC AG-212-F19]|nr:hypothetical protein AYO44_00170 [Planctomycetaceae bacterium SCGC AG-212-F19]